VCEDSISGLVSLTKETGLVYVHGADGGIIAVVLPVPGWWYDKLPDAPDPPHPAWWHEHVDTGGRFP
jgi:hypothetical protein